MKIRSIRLIFAYALGKRYILTLFFIYAIRISMAGNHKSGVAPKAADKCILLENNMRQEIK
jgi:hypothetical protein